MSKVINNSRMELTDTILIVDDEEPIRRATERILVQRGWGNLLTAGSAREALGLVAAHAPRIVLLDLGLPDGQGTDVLARLREQSPGSHVIVVTGNREVDVAVGCLQNGAWDYVIKGSDPSRLLTSVQRAWDEGTRTKERDALRRSLQAPELTHPKAFQNILTRSPRMHAAFRLAEAVAPFSEPVLLAGETGTGKELFAQAIHAVSKRPGPLVTANIAGLDEHLFDDALFGHAKGAFTGATDARKGLATAAQSGTLFLDEIGDLCLANQVKLLRFLEYREFFSLGSDQLQHSDARVIAATNQDLEELAQKGRFRRDLLFRLSPFRLEIPPLRDRTEDIPVLCDHFLQGTGRNLTAGALRLLGEYRFPGNVRELRGLILRGRLEPNLEVLDERFFRAQLKTTNSMPPENDAPTPPTNRKLFLAQELPTLRQAVDDLVTEALRRSQGNQSLAARTLGISPQALSKRLRRKSDFSE